MAIMATNVVAAITAATAAHEIFPVCFTRALYQNARRMSIGTNGETPLWRRSFYRPFRCFLSLSSFQRCWAYYSETAARKSSARQMRRGCFNHGIHRTHGKLGLLRSLSPTVSFIMIVQPRLPCRERSFRLLLSIFILFLRYSPNSASTAYFGMPISIGLSLRKA